MDSNHCPKTRYSTFLFLVGTTTVIYLPSLLQGGNAVISLIFSEYLNRIFWHTARTDVSPDDIPQWAIKVTAVAAVALVTLFCVAARKLGTRVAVVFTTLKVSFVLLVAYLLICRCPGGRSGLW